MSSNRFDFLELVNETPSAVPSVITEGADDGVIRFDAYGGNSVSQPSAIESSPGGLEEEVLYQRKSLKVMEVFGSRGTVAGAFSFPTGIAVDRAGIMFVADAYNHRLQRITPDGGVAVVGSRGSGRTQFIAPMGIAFDEDRYFYVVEQGNHRLQKFSPDGVFQFSIGREGSRPGEFRGPTGVTVVQGTKTIYVADTGNARVQCFTAQGEFIGILGAPGSIHPRMNNPQGLASDSHGNIFVVDTLSNRLLQFDPGGRFVAYYGGAPNPNNRMPDLILAEPHALTFDERGRLYITDGHQAHGRVTVISPESAAIYTVLENVGRGLGHLARPGGICAAPVRQSKMEPGAERGDIYVSDTMNHRILRFVWS